MISAIIIPQYLSSLSGLPAVIAGRRVRPAIWYCVLVSFFCDILGWALKAASIPRMWLSNAFFLLEFIAISWFFISEIARPRVRGLAYSLAVLTGSYFVISTIDRGVLNANYADAALLYAIYIYYALVGLHKVIQEIEYVMVERNPLFIFCIAILLYSSGSFFIFLFEHVMLISLGKLVDVLWVYVHNVLNIIKNLLIAYGLFLIAKKPWVR